MTYKCKICGGQTIVDALNGIAVCEYCGTKQALPLFTDDSERLLYERGNNYLLHSEYDKAENVFNQLLTIKPNAAELYWDLVLCKYGVTYVKDPKTGKYIPTCNRTHYTPIFSDENYKKAIALSSGEKKALFEADAKTIDNIQRGIIAVSKKEKPFDIFISYKETDANGNRTKDSIEAQKLYEKLTEAGYKVFFSRITLEDKIGTEYEPYIYAALYSSKVMLTICSSKENIEAVWVKNEWSRFLGFSQNDHSKTLLPLYFNMSKAELPDEFALLSAYDMSSNGFSEELLRGIKKLIPLPIMKAKKRKQMAKIFRISAACIGTVAVVLTAVFLPRHIVNQKNEEAYLNAQALLSDGQYEKAAKEFELLDDYKDSKKMMEKCVKQPDYDAAMQLYYDGNYPEATWALEKLGDYDDAAQQAEKAKLSWRKSVANIAVDTYGGVYCVTANGAVVNSNTGSDHDTVKINEHGKVISVAGSYLSSVMIGMHEDGFVDNITISDDIQWSDIVQITPTFTTKNAILLSNGKVAFGDVENSSYPNYQDPWLADATNWENIVMLDSLIESSEGHLSYTLIGLDRDGNVHSCHIAGYGFDENDVLFTYDISQLEATKAKLDALKNVKSTYFDDYNAVGLTNDGKVVGSVDFEISDSNVNDVIDFIVYMDNFYDEYKLYTLAANGKMYDAKSGTVVLSDVVKVMDNYAITRSGSVYCFDYSGINSTGFKTTIYDEWLARMD